MQEKEEKVNVMNYRFIIDTVFQDLSKGRIAYIDATSYVYEVKEVHYFS